ncbi:MAG: Rieske (2Fe-2S) protein [Propionicimonas sp.]|nr:Rieske (2Fe-2S) protein [Propionicimonas sp.]
MASDTVLSRRAVLIGVGGGALALCLAGCGAATGPQDSSSAGSSAAAGTATIEVADVPVGSGAIVGQYVVTQPTQGTFVAFSYLCTHQNLPVQEVSDTAIVCGRHGSTFSLADGSVITGPATEPLAAATVIRTGDTLTIS